MVNQIGDSSASDPLRKAGPPKPNKSAFAEKMQKIEKTEEDQMLDNRKTGCAFSLPAFLDPSLSRGPADIYYVQDNSLKTREPSQHAEAASVLDSLKPEELAVGAAGARPNNLALPPHGFERLANEVIATPPNHPPPRIDSPLSKSLPSYSKELPQSDNFWEEFNMPDEPPSDRSFEEPTQDSLEEMKRMNSEQQLFGQGTTKKVGDEEFDMASVVLRPAIREEKEKLKLAEPPKEDETKSPLLRPSSHKEKRREGRADSNDDEREEKKQTALPESKRPDDKKNETTPDDAFQPFFMPDPFLHQVAPIAKNAEIAAAAHLTPQTEALFRQMVGSVIFFQKTMPGVNRTEIILNSSDLKSSVFFNTSIVIEQHASAPGSYNICLIGSPQAVQIFDRNLAGLTTAFAAAYENRQIDFRIGRLETALSSKWSSGPRKERIDRKSDSDRFEE